jgi:hypothetical protein
MQAIKYRKGKARVSEMDTHTRTHARGRARDFLSLSFFLYSLFALTLKAPHPRGTSHACSDGSIHGKGEGKHIHTQQRNEHKKTADTSTTETHTQHRHIHNMHR